jgi:3-oxoacyl-[acyl-carrier protein] reductase
MSENNPKQPSVAFVTGAAGGLGMGIASELAGQGWTTAAGWHQQPIVAGENIVCVPVDVSSRESVVQAIEGIIKRFGRIDLLVNNAGLTVNRTVWQTSEEDWERVMDVNLRGAFLCSQAAIRPMLKQRSGHIVNISSFAARSGPRGQVAYAAAKAGLIGLTQSLAKEAGSRNVRVNAILPGVLPTGMTSGLPAEVMEDFARSNALGRINDIGEVARFVAFLAGTANISGQVFQLDSRIAPWT